MMAEISVGVIEEEENEEWPSNDPLEMGVIGGKSVKW